MSRLFCGSSGGKRAACRLSPRKGPKQISPGRALGKPGSWSTSSPSPESATTDSTANRRFIRDGSRRWCSHAAQFVLDRHPAQFVPPLSGLETGWRRFFRALPWAGLFGPFRARTWYLRANLSATNETSPAGCFRFGAREDRMNLFCGLIEGSRRRVGRDAKRRGPPWARDLGVALWWASRRIASFGPPYASALKAWARIPLLPLRERWKTFLKALGEGDSPRLLRSFLTLHRSPGPCPWQAFWSLEEKPCREAPSRLLRPGHHLPCPDRKGDSRATRGTTRPPRGIGQRELKNFSMFIR